MKRYRQYKRVSSPKQLKGASLEEQDKANRARVVALGGVIEHDYIEPGRSAFTENLNKRIAFQEMLRDARERSFDILVVYDLSRFSRSMRVSLNIAADLERLGIEVLSATEHFDRTTAAGRLTFHMLAAASQFKSDHLSERMRAVRRGEAERGRHVGPIPVGFRRERGILIPTEGIAAPRLAFELRARRMSYEAICDALREAGHRMPDGQPFTKYQVEEMLKNVVYIGRVRCNGQEYAGAHEPAIEMTTWSAVQAQCQASGPRPRASSPALLSGLARCSNCGAPMWLNGKSGAYYACSGQLTHAREPRCNMRSVYAATVEAHLLASVAVLLSDRALLDEAARELASIAAEQCPTAVVDRTKLEARLDRYKRAWLAGDIEESEYRAEQQRVRAELTRLAPAPDRPDPAAAASALADIPVLLAQATTAERRAVLQELFDAVYVKPHLALAARPTQLYRGLLKKVDKSLVEWAGWASSPAARPLLPAADIPAHLPRCRIAA